MTKTKTQKPIRTSVYIRQDYMEALNTILSHQKIRKSHQIELGLGMFFDTNRKFLESKGVNLWKK